MVQGGGAGGGGDGGGAGGGGVGGGGGGGPGGGAEQVELPPVTQQPPQEQVQVPGRVPITVRADLVNVELNPGDRRTFSLRVTNNQEEERSVTLSIEGTVFRVMTLQRTSLTIPPLSTRTVLVRATTTEDTATGTYTGSIVISGQGITQRIPASIKVVPEEEPLLDVLVNPLSPVVKPGGNLTFEYTLKNKGPTASVRDITVTFRTFPIGEPNNTVSTLEKTVAVNDTFTRRLSIQIPEGAPQERYVLAAQADYANFQKQAQASGSFEVSVLPLPLLILRSLLFNPLTYVVLFILLPALVVGIRWINYYRAKKAAQERYIAPLDMSKLPQEGPNSIEVGKIAETDTPAYMDIEQLKVHSIAAGGTGSGKSVSAQVVSEQLLKRGDVSIVVFDPTRQWTGMIKENNLEELTSMLPDYDMDPDSDPTGFKTNIIQVTDPDQDIDIWSAMEAKGEVTVILIDQLEGGELDDFVTGVLDDIFESDKLEETTDLQSLLVYDEVHRLLPKYGGKGGYTKLEQATREFRK
ncbi:MAG: DUF87 domain-containing protein, partial [Candidatus Nanohaloarchaea archaeon]|nr:DUF87 domain-containing protein [Candidatus Nanohaloarchaea archaeon]